MAAPTLRIQICGRIIVEQEGRRLEQELPGPQGRRAFAFLVLRRHELTSRSQLCDALWQDAETVSDSTVMALLSKVRRVLPVQLSGGQLRLVLPPDVWIDLEAARDAIHRAETAVAQAQWGRAWGAAQTALFAARRGFFPGETADWIETVSRELRLIHERALESYAGAALNIGATELATAERASRELIALAPLRESAHRLLMESLIQRGNTAEALAGYEQLRQRLRSELGVDPSPATQSLYRRTLGLTVPD